MKRLIIGSILASAAAMFAPQAAIAKDAPASVEVSVAGLDLDTPEGQGIMARRVGRAAKQVCGYQASRELREQMAAKQCLKLAMARAEVQMARKLENTRYGG